MKLSLASLALVGSVSAFAPVQQGPRTPTKVFEGEQSEALPWTTSPPQLDGSLPGDVGFDPFGCSTTKVGKFYFDVGNKGDTMSDLKWLREAELAHGRIAQLAAVGFIWPSVFGTFPGNEWTGVDAYSEVNPFAALGTAPSLAIYQIVTGMILIEFKRVSLIKEQGSERIPGDIGLGQGEGRWNPFNLNYAPEEYREKQVQEIKHCRLAMLGAIGLWLQASNSGLDIASQLGQALTSPEPYQKAGYFLPEGI